MPVAVRKSPFAVPSEPVPPPTVPLLVPEARLLAVLQPRTPDDHPINWPVRTRAGLSRDMGFTATSGTVTRALNGSRARATPGLLAMGMVEELVFDIEGVKEINYRTTVAGILAYQRYVTEHGAVPSVKDTSSCTNNRYKKS